MNRLFTATLLAGVAITAASADFSRAFNGAPGFYRIDNVADNWALVSPLDPKQPTWILKTADGQMDPAIANCNLLDVTHSIAPNDMNAFREVMTSMSVAEYQTMLANGFAAEGAQYRVSDVVKPYRDDQDANAAYSAIYNLTDTSQNLTIRIKVTQVFSTKGFVTASCSTLPAYFPSKQFTMSKFVDDVEFITGETLVTASLNRNSLSDLTGDDKILMDTEAHSDTDTLSFASMAIANAGAGNLVSE